jgi:hypothetical protein
VNPERDVGCVHISLSERIAKLGEEMITEDAVEGSVSGPYLGVKSAGAIPRSALYKQTAFR